MWIYNSSVHGAVPLSSSPLFSIKMAQHYGASAVGMPRIPSLPVAAHKAFQMGTSIFTGGHTSWIMDQDSGARIFGIGD